MGDWTTRYRGIKGEPLIPSTVTKYWHDQKPYSGDEQFNDESFPATLDSILSTRCVWDSNHQEELRSQGEWKFLRSQDFLGSNFCVYDDDVTHNDIGQGSLGDCYFLSALAAMAEFPGLIEQNFRLGPKKSQNGYYEIFMFIDEEWQIVIVDDSFPALKWSNKPAFCLSKRNVIWMLLLEKAWAKINDGFSNTIAGKSVWPMHILTGFPCSIHSLKNSGNKDDIWRKIKLFDSRNDIMCCSAFNKGQGIYNSHQYTLRYAGEVKDDNGDTVRLLCIRNPWGSHEWDGDWSDNSSKWTPTLRKLLGVQVKDDGVFYMSYDDFLNYYDSCEVAHSPNFNKNVSMFSHSDSSPKIYNLIVEENTTLSVNVSCSEKDFNCSVFLCNYDSNNLCCKESSYLHCNSPYDGRIYNVTEGGNYLVALYPHSEASFKVRFSSNGKHALRPNYSCDKRLGLLSHLKAQGIPKVYFEKIQNTEAAKFLDSIDGNYSEVSKMCKVYDCESIKDKLSSEYKELCGGQCANNMLCQNMTFGEGGDFNNVTSGNGFSSLGINDEVKKENTKEPEIDQIEDDSPVIIEQNTKITRQLDLNYKYFSLNFPNRKVENVVIDMTLKDQGWCSVSNSGSWVDIEIYEVYGPKIHEERIFENFGVPNWKDYSLTIDSSHHLFKYMNKNFVVNVVARSAWGWEMSIQKGKCVIA